MATLQNLTLISGSQSGFTGYNDTMTQLGALSFGSVVNKILSSPPTSPTIHELYILSATGSGGWTGYQAGDIAYYNDSNAWTRFVPNLGLRLYSVPDSGVIVWDGTAWVNAYTPVSGGGGLTTQYLTLTGGGTATPTDTSRCVYIDMAGFSGTTLTLDLTSPSIKLSNNSIWKIFFFAKPTGLTTIAFTEPAGMSNINNKVTSTPAVGATISVEVTWNPAAPLAQVSYHINDF